MSIIIIPQLFVLESNLVWLYHVEFVSKYFQVVFEAMVKFCFMEIK